MPSLPLRPRCDVPPFKAIAAELAKRKASEPSERGKVLREAYREYAAKAARPYAFRPFCQQFNLWEQRRFEEEVEAHKASESFWEGVAIPKSRVTAVSGELACFNVKGGALRIWNGSREIWFEPGGRMPEAIVCASWGGSITLDALRFCVSHKISLVFIDWPSGLLSFGGWPAKHNAALVRAQCSANPVRVARSIVAQKIRHSLAAGWLTDREVQGFCEALEKARSLDQVITIEARAARLYWGRMRIEPQYRGKIPHGWHIWAGRPSGFGKGPRGARKGGVQRRFGRARKGGAGGEGFTPKTPASGCVPFRFRFRPLGLPSLSVRLMYEIGSGQRRRLGMCGRGARPACRLCAPHAP